MAHAASARHRSDKRNGPLRPAQLQGSHALQQGGSVARQGGRTARQGCPEPRQGGRTACGAVLAAVLKVSAAAAFAAVLAFGLTTALGVACAAILPVPSAQASEASTSVGVALVPLEDGAGEGASPGGDEGSPDSGASGGVADGSGPATAGARTAPLPQTGDVALRCAVPLALAALAAAIALALGRDRVRIPRHDGHARRLWRERGGHRVRQGGMRAMRRRMRQGGARAVRRRGLRARTLRCQHAAPPAPGTLGMSRTALALLLAVALAASCLAVASRAFAAEEGAHGTGQGSPADSAPIPGQESPADDAPALNEGPLVAEDPQSACGSSSASPAPSSTPPEPSSADKTPLAESAAAGARSTIFWGSTRTVVHGDPVVGGTVSVDVMMDPTYPADIQENLQFRWWCADDRDLGILSTTNTIVVPEKALGHELELWVNDTTRYITSTLVVDVGVVGRTLTGSVSLEGDWAVGSTITAQTSLPEDAEPIVTWFAGTDPNAHGEELGTGATLVLPPDVQGLSVSAIVEDASGLYYGTIEAFGATAVRSDAAAPWFVSSEIDPDGTVWVTVGLDESAVGNVDAIVIEQWKNGAWKENTSRRPSSTARTLRINLSLADDLLDPGYATLRAHTEGAYGTSGPSEEHTVVAQIGATVPLTMTCEVFADGTALAGPQELTNTGDLDLDLLSVTTVLDGVFEDAGYWTGKANGATFYIGPFDGTCTLRNPRNISPGETLAFSWETTGLRFEGASPGTVPARYGTISFRIAPGV